MCVSRAVALSNDRLHFASAAVTSPVVQSEAFSGHSKCSLCQGVEHAITCSNGIARVNNGVWRAPSPQSNGHLELRMTSTTFMTCMASHHCLSANDSISSSSSGAVGLSIFTTTCREGHTGPLCALCEPGWAMDLQSFTCVICDQQGVSITLLLLYIAGMNCFAPHPHCPHHRWRRHGRWYLRTRCSIRAW